VADQRAATAVEDLKTLLSVAILGVTAFTISVVILVLRVDLDAKLLGICPFVSITNLLHTKE
jgi:hypothetical protein